MDHRLEKERKRRRRMETEKRTLGVRRPVNEECQEAKPIADSAQRKTP